MEKLKNLKFINKIYLLLLAIVALNLILFSSVSPLHSIMNMQYNEWLYYIIGKGMKYGKVPYIDLIDHKGPYTFFIFYFASLIGEKSHIGLYVVAVVFYYIITLYSYKISKLILDCTIAEDAAIKDVTSVFTSVAIFVLSSSYYMSFGTITCETFILAFELIAYYLFMKYALNGKCEHNKVNSFVYGVLAGLSFFIKANGVLVFVPIAIMLLFILIRKKEYKNLAQNIAYGIVGFIISLLPAIIYCMVNHCLFEMIQASFVVNKVYTGTGLPSINSLTLSLVETINEFKEFIVVCILSIPMFSYLIKDEDNEIKKHCILFYVLSLIINIYAVFMSARPYTNYLNFLTPYVIPFILFIIAGIVKLFGEKNNSLITFAVIGIIIVNALSYSLDLELSNMNGYAQTKISKEVTNICKNVTNQKDKKKLLVVGYAPYLYETFDTIPNEKYFATPVVSRKKYSEPYDALVKRIDMGTEKVVVVAFGRSMVKDEEFKTNVYNSLNKHYAKIGEAKVSGTNIEVYVKGNIEENADGK